MTIYLGTDHRGFAAKQLLLEWLGTQQLEVVDCGATELNPDDDFPDYAFAVADAVAKNPDSRGIVLCGSGVGVLIAANKVAGIRAGLAASTEIVRAGRNDDDINVLAIPVDVTSAEKIQEMIKLFLSTAFERNDRHQRRLAKISSRERV